MDKKQEFEALAEDALFGISNSDSGQRFLYLNPNLTSSLDIPWPSCRTNPRGLNGPIPIPCTGRR